MGNSAQRLRIEFKASLVVLVIVALLPIVLTNMYWQGVVIVSLYFGLQAMGWNLLTGYTGQMNLAPAAFAMVGAYGVGMVTYHFELSPWVGIPVGVASASLIGLILGRIVLRLQGPYVALTTLCFAEILRLIVGNSYTLTRGDLGLNIPAVFQGRLPYYYLMLGAVVLVQVALYITMRSKMGLFLQAIRDDEVATASRGISIVWWKTLAFVASAAICGLAGTLYAPFAGLISPELGLILNTGLVISMVVIGGMGTMVGPVVGALLVYSTTELLRDFGGYHLIIFALLVIVIARFFRSGLWGLLVLVADRFNAKPDGNQARDKGTLDNVVSEN